MPELSNERLAGIRNEYGGLLDGLPSNLPDGAGAASAFYLSLSLGEVVSMATELQQRRAFVVTPEMVTVGTFIASSDHGVGVQWGDLGPLKSGDKIYAALPVSHETGDGEGRTKPKEWYARKATMEGDLEVGAGFSALPPPAFNGCICSCHRGSGIIHMVACCAPAPTDETQGVKRYQSEAVAWQGWPRDDTQVVFDDTNGETGRVWHPHRGYWAYKTATALARAEARIRELELAVTTLSKGMDEEARGFVFAILGADTWLEAGAIWDGNPVQRKAAHTAISQQTGSGNDE